jgi:hypothetical protein
MVMQVVKNHMKGVEHLENRTKSTLSKLIVGVKILCRHFEHTIWEDRRLPFNIYTNASNVIC